MFGMERFTIFYDENGKTVSQPSGASLTVKTDRSFFARIISFFAVLFRLNTVNLNK